MEILGNTLWSMEPAAPEPFHPCGLLQVTFPTFRAQQQRRFFPPLFT